MLTWYVRNSASRNNGANMYLLLLNFSDEKMAHLQSSVFKLSKDLIDSIHEEGIVAYTS